METRTETKKVVTLILDESEARWLRETINDPEVYNPSSFSEDYGEDFDEKMRHALYRAFCV